MIRLPDYINNIADAIFKKNYDYTSAQSFVVYGLPIDDQDECLDIVEVTVKIIKRKGDR